MTDLEKWSVFLRYANEPEHRDTVNGIIAAKGEIEVAADLLMGISKDERERAIFRSRRMYRTDYESDMATAWDNGMNEGMIKAATEMIANGEPDRKIMMYTGLKPDEIAALRKKAQTLAES